MPFPWRGQGLLNPTLPVGLGDLHGTSEWTVAPLLPSFCPPVSCRETPSSLGQMGRGVRVQFPLALGTSSFNLLPNPEPPRTYFSRLEGRTLGRSHPALCPPKCADIEHEHTCVMKTCHEQACVMGAWSWMRCMWVLTTLTLLPTRGQYSHQNTQGSTQQCVPPLRLGVPEPSSLWTLDLEILMPYGQGPLETKMLSPPPSP